jgi:hypothetical protein
MNSHRANENRKKVNTTIMSKFPASELLLRPEGNVHSSIACSRMKSALLDAKRGD